jgi:proliferating cell nuclear antigen
METLSIEPLYFEASFKDAAVFKQIFEALKDIITDGTFDFDSNGMSLQGMDTAHVALCELNISENGFLELRCDKANSIGLNTDVFSKILKCANNDDIITLQSNIESDRLLIMFDTVNHDRLSEFELRLMDLNSESLTIPPHNYAYVIKMTSINLRKTIADLKGIGGKCKIKVTNEEIDFKINSDIGTALIEVKKGNSSEGGCEIKTREDYNDKFLELTFGLSYLTLFTKATPLSNPVLICLDETQPMLIQYNIEDYGVLKYYLAPDLEED